MFTLKQQASRPENKAPKQTAWAQTLRPSRPSGAPEKAQNLKTQVTTALQPLKRPGKGTGWKRSFHRVFF